LVRSGSDAVSERYLSGRHSYGGDRACAEDVVQEVYLQAWKSFSPVRTRIGLRDHIHCSVFRKYLKNRLTAEEILNPTPEMGVKAISTKYAGLILIVRSVVPERYRMTMAHQCTYKGREFIHLSLMDESNILSLVITQKVNRETFRAEDMLPALSESGIPMYQAGVQRFEISAFETSDFLVYFISDVDKQRNTELTLALAPRVNGFLARPLAGAEIEFPAAFLS
jgi:hypothetical protein